MDWEHEFLIIIKKENTKTDSWKIGNITKKFLNIMNLLRWRNWTPFNTTESVTPTTLIVVIKKFS